MKIPFNLLRANRSGFSLVEVTLALGLVAFVLVSLLGLASVGLNASRSSATDISLGQVTDHVFSVGVTPLADGASATFYFTEEGEVLPSGTGSFYMAVLTASVPQDSQAANGGMFLLGLEVTWPGGKRTFYGSAIAPL